MMDMEAIQWEARVFADESLKKSVQRDIAKLALVVLGNKELHINYDREEGFYSPIEKKKVRYEGKFGDYYVWGDTRTEEINK